MAYAPNVAPIGLTVGGRPREFHDGGGYCCPGRLDPSQRPPGKLSHLASIVQKVMDEHDLVNCLPSSARLGQSIGFTKNPRPGFSGPLPEEAVLTIRRRLCEALSQHRGRAVTESVPSGQPFALDLEHALLE